MFLKKIIFLSICLFCFYNFLFAQIIITGNIHNANDSLPLPNVAIVNATLKKVTYTNLRGQFSIEANWNDTIEISHIGFVSRNFIFTKGNDFVRFFLQKYHYPLTEIDIVSRNYKKDSIEMRREYDKVFNWSPLQLNDFLSINQSGVGISIDAIYQSLRFRHNRLMQNFKATLLRDEQERFIDHKFTPELVTNLTGLKEDELKYFMKKYRPSYYLLLEVTDYEFYSYVKYCYKEFLRNN